jgi:hypothetical protein
MKKTSFIPILAMLLCMFTNSCDDKYSNQLTDLGKRVEALEDSVLKINKQIEYLHTLVVIIEEKGYATEIVENEDGTHTITFSNGTSVTLRDGKVGEDGKQSTLDIGVRKDDDGFYYWIINGNWLYDENGNKVRAGAKDGQNGKDGFVPQWRKSNDNKWEYSLNGGVTWIKTNVPADGKDGRPDLFSYFELSKDGKYVTIHLTNGQSFDVPIYYN